MASPLAYAVLAASKGLRYDCQLDDLDVDPSHGTNAHGYGVSVSHIVIRIAGVARPVRDRRKAAGAAGSRVTISRVAAILTPWVHPDRPGRTGTAADSSDVES